MSATCTQCSRLSRTPLHRTVTGRQLCDSCFDTLQGLSAGALATGTVGGAIATAGWFSRIRSYRRSHGRS